MFGLIVMLSMTLSGHPLIINKMGLPIQAQGPLTNTATTILYVCTVLRYLAR